MPAHTPRLKPHSLALALAALLPSVAFAAGQDTAHRDRHLTELSSVQVTASPLQGDAESLARPVEVLAGERLDEQKAGTLGDTVAKLPGVQSTFFGPGVGRPIIRGQEGPRVAVLSNGMGNMDASTVSADHATSIEPFLADQIEVLKGPATLLFGSGAIGGAVNVVDGRIARELPERPLSGRAELRGNSVNNERSGMFRLDGVSGNVVLHVDGLVRNGDDYRIPGYAVIDSLEDHHDDHDHDHAGEEGEEPRRGRLDNSSIRTRAGGVGATWLGDGGYFGVSASTYRTNYGIPNGAHVHADGDDHGHDHGHDHGDEEEGGDEHDVRIDMVQNRFETKAGIYNPVSFLKNINARVAYTDYEHVELEAGTPSTRFTNRGIEARLEAVQQQIGGWDGAFGLQFGNSDSVPRAKRRSFRIPARRTSACSCCRKSSSARSSWNWAAATTRSSWTRPVTTAAAPSVPPTCLPLVSGSSTMPLTCASAWTAPSEHRPTKSCMPPARTSPPVRWKSATPT